MKVNCAAQVETTPVWSSGPRGYTLGLRGGWDIVILMYFVVCGVSQLARFNVTAAALADASTSSTSVGIRQAGTQARCRSTVDA